GIRDRNVSGVQTCALPISMNDPQQSVRIPIMLTIIKNHSYPENIGENLATKYIPAFTIVAECKYALTGVGASIASGNQMWKGNWADLLKAPSKIKTRINGKYGLFKIK